MPDDIASSIGRTSRRPAGNRSELRVGTVTSATFGLIVSGIPDPIHVIDGYTPSVGDEVVVAVMTNESIILGKVV